MHDHHGSTSCEKALFGGIFDFPINRDLITSVKSARANMLLI